jgi:hypothetical protein
MMFPLIPMSRREVNVAARCLIARGDFVCKPLQRSRFLKERIGRLTTLHNAITHALINGVDRVTHAKLSEQSIAFAIRFARNHAMVRNVIRHQHDPKRSRNKRTQVKRVVGACCNCARLPQACDSER